MDWFAPTVHFCRINQSGKGSARRDVGHAIQAGVSISLDATNLKVLVEMINLLPPPSKQSLPVQRQIVVGCIRSNQWFRAVYGRADIPDELEKIAETTGASLPWYLPTVQGRPIARAKIGEFACLASDAPTAISKSDVYGQVQHSQMHVWSIGRWGSKTLANLTPIPDDAYTWQSTAISPDGRIVVVASHYGLYAVDLQTEKLLWRAGRLDGKEYVGKVVVIGGPYLYTAGAHVVERWDLASGQKLGILTTNENIVKSLKTSRDGKVFLASFGSYSERPKYFSIWEGGTNNSAAQFTEAQGAFANLSPDGEMIALSRFGRKELVLLRWRTGERKEIPLRNSQGAYAVYWSADGKRMAVYVDTYPASIYIYDTTTWKPIAQWGCGRIGESSEFIFGTDGALFQIRGNEINALDVASLKRITED